MLYSTYMLMVKKKMQISVKIFLVSARALYITAAEGLSILCQGRGGRHRACRRGVQEFQKICFIAEHSDWRLTGVSPSRRHAQWCVILDPLYSNFPPSSILIRELSQVWALQLSPFELYSRCRTDKNCEASCPFVTCICRQSCRQVC
jgi:hypothetical protein